MGNERNIYHALFPTLTSNLVWYSHDHLLTSLKLLMGNLNFPPVNIGSFRLPFLFSDVWCCFDSNPAKSFIYSQGNTLDLCLHIILIFFLSLTDDSLDHKIFCNITELILIYSMKNLLNPWLYDNIMVQIICKKNLSYNTFLITNLFKKK